MVHEIALMVGYEALGSALKAQEQGTVRSHLKLPSSKVGLKLQLDIIII